MARQIYIDSEGNEVLLSGTVNSADILPITTGSGTNTKAVIDSKANATSSSGTMTTTIAASGYRATFRKLGDIKFVSFGLTTNTTITTNTVLFTLPENATTNIDAIGHTRTDNFNLFITGNSVKYNTVASLASGTDMFANFWYI